MVWQNVTLRDILLVDCSANLADLDLRLLSQEQPLNHNGHRDDHMLRVCCAYKVWDLRIRLRIDAISGEAGVEENL